MENLNRPIQVKFRVTALERDAIRERMKECNIRNMSRYCKYEHIDCLDLRYKIDEFRRAQTTGKKTFVKTFKPASVLEFPEEETVEIIQYCKNMSAEYA